MIDYKKYFSRLKSTIFKSKRNVAIFIGILGIVLIILSSFSGKNTSNSRTNSRSALADTSEDYADSVEKKLEGIISDMLGGTKVQVLVTLDTSAEYIYASETKTDTGISEDRESQKNQQNDSNEKSYVVMKDADGNETALVVCKIMPEIRGVVVVCESGQTDAVAAAVRLAVKSALNIDESKICIIGRYNQKGER